MAARREGQTAPEEFGGFTGGAKAIIHTHEYHRCWCVSSKTFGDGAAEPSRLLCFLGRHDGAALLGDGDNGFSSSSSDGMDVHDKRVDAVFLQELVPPLTPHRRADPWR